MADNTGLPPGLDPTNNRMINGKVYTHVSGTDNQDLFNYLGTNSGFNSLDEAKAADDAAPGSWQQADLSPGYSWGDIATKILLPMAAAGAGGSALAGLAGVGGAAGAAGGAAESGATGGLAGMGIPITEGLGGLTLPATSSVGLSALGSGLPIAAGLPAGLAGASAPGATTLGTGAIDPSFIGLGETPGIAGGAAAPTAAGGAAAPTAATTPTITTAGGTTLPSATLPGGGAVTPGSAASLFDTPASGNWVNTLQNIAKPLQQASQIAGQAAQGAATGQLAQGQYELTRDQQAEKNQADAEKAAVDQANQAMANKKFTNAANALAANQGLFGSMLGAAKPAQFTNLPAGVRVPTAGPFADLFSAMASQAPTYSDLAGKTAATVNNLPTLPDFKPAPLTPEPQTSGMQKALNVFGQIAPYASLASGLAPTIGKIASWL